MDANSHACTLIQIGAAAPLVLQGWSGMFAAFCGAAATAIVESPCELFRHQAQAGIISTNFLKVRRVQKDAGTLTLLCVSPVKQGRPHGLSPCCLRLHYNARG